MIHSLREIERRHIINVLKAHWGNITLTSVSLGINRSTLYRKMKEHGIDPKDYKRGKLWPDPQS